MKLISTLLTAAVMSTVALSGTAAEAAWARPDLAIVVYNALDNQVMVDLLDTQTYDFTQKNVHLAPAGTINLSQFPTISRWADLRMGAEAGFLTPTFFQEWFVTTQTTAPPVGKTAVLSFSSSNAQIKSGASSVDPGDTGLSILSSSDYLSYNSVSNSNGNTPGQYGGFNDDWRDGEAALAALDTPGGYQDMYLYRFDILTLAPGAAGTDYTAVLRLNADGSVVLNPTAVPEPTSLALIGSVLVGLLGVRRKRLA